MPFIIHTAIRQYAIIQTVLLYLNILSNSHTYIQCTPNLKSLIQHTTTIKRLSVILYRYFFIIDKIAHAIAAKLMIDNGS